MSTKNSNKKYVYYWYNSYIMVETPPHYVDCRSDDPEQFRAIGWVKGKLYSVIFEIREDEGGEYHHLVTLWKSTKYEEKLYETYS